MMSYHITRRNSIEACSSSTCAINEKLHFNNLYNAINILIKKVKNDGCVINSSNEVIKKYRGEINYNCGVTDHYKNFRMLREKRLTELLGKGESVNSFLVDKGDGNLQIQEILDNGVMVVYSYETNRRITTFTPHPDRITSLYIAIGEFPPDSLIKQSEHNIRRGYNNIHSEIEG